MTETPEPAREEIAAWKNLAEEMTRRAIAARDADDMEGFREAVSELRAMKDPWGRPSQFTESRVARAMYPDDGAARILVLRGKHGSRYIDVSTPDLFASAALSVLSERLSEGYWYSEGSTPSGKENPLEAAWLDSLEENSARLEPPASLADFLAMTSPFKAPPGGRAPTGLTPQGIARIWRELPEFKFAVANLSASILAARADKVAKKSGPDALAAFLGLVAIQKAPEFGAFVKASLAGGGELSRMVCRNAKRSDAEQAREILKIAASEFRRGGRLAFAFLRERSDGEYEGIELEDIERLPAPTLPSPAPEADTGVSGPPAGA